MSADRPDEQPPGPGRLARFRSRFALPSADDALAADLQSSAKLSGATPIAEANGGEQVVVCGTIRSLTLRPHAGVPALEAELYDGSGKIVLIWLGRRLIRGVEPGRALVVRGRATRGRDSLVVYNPRYELRPHGSE